MGPSFSQPDESYQETHRLEGARGRQNVVLGTRSPPSERCTRYGHLHLQTFSPLMPLVASSIRNEEKARRRKKKFHLFFLPRTSSVCTKWLEVCGNSHFILYLYYIPKYSLKSKHC